jgi:hypothetical protein
VRELRSLWLWLLVAVQVAIPLSYYLVREDRDDERFAWRMFSAVRMTRCEVAGFDQRDASTRTPVALPEQLHSSWIRSLERGRRRVIELFLASRCEQEGVRVGVLERRCKTPAGTELPLALYRFHCAERAYEVLR